MLSRFLMASYLYYIWDISIMPDEEYDQLAKDLLDDWDNVEHIHKHLVIKEDLQAGTLYSLKDTDYPMMCQNAAISWYTEKEGINLRNSAKFKDIRKRYFDE